MHFRSDLESSWLSSGSISASGEDIPGFTTPLQVVATPAKVTTKMVLYGSRWRTASWILTIPTGHRAWRQGVAPNGKFGATAWSNFG